MSVAAASDRAGSRRRLIDLVTHLAHRRLTSQHRFTVLGWLWPLLRQLAQLAVLVFLFSKIVDLGIDDYPAFVFTALLVWSWFAAALGAGAASLLTDRHLVFSPRFPVIALPLVAVAVPLIDMLLALPVLLVLLLVEGRLAWTALLFPLLVAAQYVLTAGLALASAAMNVFVRDVGNVVGVAVLLLFYVTPIFYGFKTVPDEYQWLLSVNPMTPVVNCARALLFDGVLPAARDVLMVAAYAGVSAVFGVWTFRRLQPRFVDEL